MLKHQTVLRKSNSRRDCATEQARVASRTRKPALTFQLRAPDWIIAVKNEFSSGNTKLHTSILASQSPCCTKHLPPASAHSSSSRAKTRLDPPAWKSHPEGRGEGGKLVFPRLVDETGAPASLARGWQSFCTKRTLSLIHI